MVLSQPNINFTAFVALSLKLTTTAVPLILASSTSNIPLHMSSTIELVQPPSDHSLTARIVAVVSLYQPVHASIHPPIPTFCKFLLEIF